MLQFMHARNPGLAQTVLSVTILFTLVTAASGHTSQQPPVDREQLQTATERFCQEQGMKMFVDGFVGWSAKNVADMERRAQLVVEVEVESVFPATLDFLIQTLDA